MLFQRTPLVSLKLRESAFNIYSLLESFIHYLCDTEKMEAGEAACEVMI